MKFIAKVSFIRLWIVFLVASLSMVTVSDVSSAATPKIGDEYGGGIVFYVDHTGEHGLIAAKADLPGPNFTWDNAKKACANLVENGYSDWYLPSKDELNKLFYAKSTVGGCAGYIYWSSTESSADDAWYQLFGNGIQYDVIKDFEWRVRPVRVF